MTLLVSFVVLVVSFLVVSEIRFQANKLASTLDWDTSLMVDYVGADEATIRASGEDQQGEPRARFGLTCADAMSDAAVTVLDEAVEGYDLRDYYT